MTANEAAESAPAPRRNPGEVEAVASRVGALGQDQRRAGERDETEEQVEPEDGAKRVQPNQHAADQRTHRERQAGDSRPHPEHLGPRPPLGIQVADHREGARLGGRCAEAHDHPARNEDVGARRQRGDDRAAAEEDDPRQHDLLAAELVAERAEDQHEAGEDQGVTVDHPLQLADAGVKPHLHVGKGDADDGVVHEGQEQHEQQRGQAEAPAHRAEGELRVLRSLRHTWLVGSRWFGADGHEESFRGSCAPKFKEVTWLVRPRVERGRRCSPEAGFSGGRPEGAFASAPAPRGHREPGS